MAPYSTSDFQRRNASETENNAYDSLVKVIITANNKRFNNYNDIIIIIIIIIVIS